VAETPVLVTGAAGFIGSNLVRRLLEEGERVVGVDDLSTGSLANLAPAREQRHVGRFEFDLLDVRDPAFVSLVERVRPSVVHHLAAQVDVRVSVEDPIRDAEVNVLGTLRVLDAARRVDVERVVYAGSIGSYGEPPEADLPVDERLSSPALSPYGASKRAAIEFLATYGELHGIDHVTLTLANVYGPHQTTSGEGGVVATFLGRMLADQPCTIHGDGEQTRDLVFVDDVVDAFVRAGRTGGGTRMLIGTGVRTSIRDVYELCARATGYERDPIMAPARVGEVRHSALDASRARALLGWVPWTGLEEGIAATAAWARERGTSASGA
jgi:UDP-glucose 4-epimerase